MRLIVVLVGVCAAGPAMGGQLRAWGSIPTAKSPVYGENLTSPPPVTHGSSAVRWHGRSLGQNDSGWRVPPGTYWAVAAGADFSK
jgi:hypothetical protein